MKKLVSIFIIILCAAFVPADQTNTDTNSKLKAVYLYNFSKLFDWPAAYKQGNFVIGIVTKTKCPIFTELSNMSSTKTVGSQKFEIKNYAGIEDIEKCHMIFIPTESSGLFAKVLSKVKGNSTLIVTEKEGFAKSGSIVNFYVDKNKIKFELSKNSAQKADLKVGSQLDKLATIVD